VTAFGEELLASQGVTACLLRFQNARRTMSDYLRKNIMKNMKSFIDRLMARMTIEEKIGQLNQVTVNGDITTGAVVNGDVERKLLDGQVGSILNTRTPQKLRGLQELAVHQSRLGIPLLFGLDVIHGHKTVFPIPLGLSCTWDMELIERSARIAAKEASADGIRWVFSPMVDIARDPRWGRVAEGSGEDPYLGSRIAEAMVRGYQGKDLKAIDSVMACVKHFALYGAAEGGREYNGADMSPLTMHETYLAPFRAAVEAGAGSLMAAFNDIGGTPATAHKGLMTKVVRRLWGFKGFVVSDYTGVNEMVAHGTGDLQTVSANALKAGVDMDMVGEGFLTTLKKSLDEGNVTQVDIDRACRRVLEAKFKLGLFDDPFKYLDDDRAATEMMTLDHMAVAREMAAKACVLLKNDGQALPLKKSGSIALIGPLADDKRNMLGTWAVSGDADKCVSVREGIRTLAGDDVAIHYAKGANIVDDAAMAERLNVFGPIAEIDERAPAEMIAEAVKAAEQSDLVVAVVGEAKEHSGECSSRSEIGLPGSQRALLEALKKTGKPLVVVVMSGRPLTLGWEAENADALLLGWFGGTQAGNGLADVLFGAVNPAGKLTMTFPHSVGQIPLYYNHKATGRPYTGKFQKFTSCYLDVPNTPLFPFGHGLSYTRFEYGPVKLSRTRLSGPETLTASVTLTNAGPCGGEETAQLYIGDPVCSRTRPVRELKGFQKLYLAPGEQKTVRFTITPEDLKFHLDERTIDWEAGEFVIEIGTSSSQTQSARLTWEKPAALSMPVVRGRAPS
jgi:beta-glucosidase